MKKLNIYRSYKKSLTDIPIGVININEELENAFLTEKVFLSPGYIVIDGKDNFNFLVTTTNETDNITSQIRRASEQEIDVYKEKKAQGEIKFLFVTKSLQNYYAEYQADNYESEFTHLGLFTKEELLKFEEELTAWCGEILK